MNEERDGPSSNDDSPERSKPEVSQAEIDVMTEDDWLDVKKSLQEFLCRMENVENPAFDDQTVIAWITEYSNLFDEFYQQEKNTNPLQLVVWARSTDDIELNRDFIQVWEEFLNSTQHP